MNTKISVFTIFVGFALLFAGCSKDDENIPGGIEPPKTILDAFNAKYPDARDTEWTVNDDYYVIDFENNSLDNTAWFDHLGVWAMIKTDLRLSRTISNKANMPVGRSRKPIPSAEPEWEPYIK